MSGQFSTVSDAIVIGAGHNGLVAANLLADRGWEVTVLEEADEPGGAVRSGELIEAGFTHDLFSGFYPFALASPHIQRLELERWGVRWLISPVAVAHPSRDGRCPVVSLDIEETASSLEQFASGDGDGWRALYSLWERVRSGALGAFFTPFPPARAVVELARRLGPAELLRFARFCLLPVRQLGDESFAARADRGFSPATRYTPTSAPRRRSAACSAGSCAPSPSSMASQSSVAAPATSPVPS